VLDVVSTERGRFYNVIDNPKNWNVDTRCEGWQVRDLVGHMIDVTENYLNRWDMAHKGEYPQGRGWLVMADDLNKGALAFRSLSRDEAISRLKAASETDDHLRKLDGGRGAALTWLTFSGTTFVLLPRFQIMDCVHTWDMHWGLGDKEAKLMSNAGFGSYMFIIWQYSVDHEAAKGVDITYGVKVDGEWGGRWKLRVKDGQLSYEAADDCRLAVSTIGSSDMVLTAYQRFRAAKRRVTRRL
jgi:hypothetical protein